MKTLGSPRPWPPEVCDELRHQLSRYSWSRRNTPAVDDLFAIVEELDGWLRDNRPYSARNARKTEWASLKEDVEASFALLGEALGALVPSAVPLLGGLHDDLGPRKSERDVLLSVLAQVRSELYNPDAPGAAFTDLVTAIQDPTTRSNVIEGKVDMIDAVLRFTGRALGASSSNLRGILNNDATYVNHALHLLDGQELSKTSELEDDAGLSEEQRVALAGRWVGYQPGPEHHVVWLFYTHARIGGWRFPVGTCEFFNGPALLSALGEVDQVRDAGGTYPGDRPEFNTPPAELIADNESGKYLREGLEWPDGEHWVAVRVDLGTSAFYDVVEAARDQVRALIALAAFDLKTTSWTELSGHKDFIDGSEAGSSAPFEELNADRKWVVADHTDDWLREHQTDLGTYITSNAAMLHTPEVNAVITAATAFANTTNGAPALALLEAVRVIETQASVLHIHWKELVNQYATPANALLRAQIGAAKTIEAIANDDELRDQLPHLHDLPDEFNTYEDRRRVTNMATALARLPEVVDQLPTYNLACRKLRHTANDLATPATIAAFIDRETAFDQRLLRRVHRVRNSLTHGGPWHPTIVRTTSAFIKGKAKHVTNVNVRALLDGQPLTETLRKYRGETAGWIADLANADNITAALFPGMADQD